jgi:hypothetical protein
MTWSGLENELAEWSRARRTPDLWWRDDDAGAPTPEVARLLALANSSGVPLALAAVPANAELALLAGLDAGVTVIQHGTDHVNRAAPGEKKTEFPAAEKEDEALARLASGKKTLEEKAKARFCPVLVPPWNRLPPQLAAQLAAAKYAGLSQYRPRKRAMPFPGLKQVNTHVDIIAWQGDRGFVGEDAALRMLVSHLASRRRGEHDASEPTGVLTHHERHDEAAWRFLERLFAFTREAGARWRAAAELFS